MNLVSEYIVKKEILSTFETLMGLEKVQEGLDFIEADQPRAIEEQKVLVAIEAPTFHEEKKARRYAEYLTELGLEEVHLDQHGNVLGTLKGTGDGPTILLEAHLDTVFALGTDVAPVEKDGKIFAPGICDDTRGLAANLSVVRAFKETGIVPKGDIIFAGTVGEEGLGGMWGMRALLEDHPEIKGTISIDGAGCDSILFEATGIINYEVTYTGPGGHAYVKFGLPSPIQAAGRAIGKLSDMQVPEVPKTTFTVSLVGGGQAIHGIAEKATFTINMRSDSAEELAKLETFALANFELGAQEENIRWGSDLIKVEYKKILDVPAGSQPSDALIIQAAWRATECIGVEPRLEAGGCTNTNMPVCMGIPAVTLGRGGNEGGVHTVGEWFDPEGTYRSPQKSFLLLLALAGVEGSAESIL